MTVMIRNTFNPFADPLFPLFILIIILSTFPIKFVLNTLSDYIHLWEINEQEHLKVDIGAINRLDRDNNEKRIIKQIQSNPFRHKFIKVNREWIISNIANILGGKSYMNSAGNERRHLELIF